MAEVYFGEGLSLARPIQDQRSADSDGRAFHHSDTVPLRSAGIRHLVPRRRIAMLDAQEAEAIGSGLISPRALAIRGGERKCRLR